MNRNRATFLIAGAALGLLGVAAGAFGAHALEGQVSDHHLAIWKTAAHYQQVHAVLLVAVALLPRSSGASRALNVASALLVFGMLVFSGTLYGIVLGGPGALGAVTPIGGLSLMGGWLALAVHGWQRRTEADL